MKSNYCILIKDTKSNYTTTRTESKTLSAITIVRILYRLRTIRLCVCVYVYVCVCEFIWAGLGFTNCIGLGSSVS